VVDYLADNEFPVQDVTIVGVDLMQVERVLYRLTWGKVIGGGVVSGAWLGLFLGLLLSLSPPAARSDRYWSVWSAASFSGHLHLDPVRGDQRAQRDFASTMQLVAGRYDVLCDPKSAEQARDMLARLAI